MSLRHSAGWCEFLTNKVNHVTHMNGLCLTYWRVVSHTWTSCVAHMNESRHTCEGARESKRGMVWVPQKQSESSHIYEWDMSHTWTSRVTHIKESCHTWMCHVTQKKGVRGIKPSMVWVLPKQNESHHMYEWVMSCVWMSHVTHMKGLVDLNVAWQVPTREIYIYIYMYIYVSYHTYEWVMSHTWTSRVTHMKESCLTYEWVMSHIWRGSWI